MHTHYLWHGAREGASAAASRLDRLARWELPGCWEHALGQALGGDERVVVLKAVSTRFVLRLDESASDAEIANRWASALAMAVARAADASSELPDDEARVFEDTPAFIAAFFGAITRGDTPEAAWADWVFKPFSRFHGLGPAGAIMAILSEQPTEAPGVLARLSTSGRLDAVLKSLHADQARVVWRDLRAETSPRVRADACRPTFAAALRIAVALGWRRFRSFTTAEAETALREFLATDPEPPDWRNRRALATAVFDSLAFLDRGRAPSSVATSSETAKDSPTNTTLDHVLASLEWLDTDWLRERIDEPSRYDSSANGDDHVDVSSPLAASTIPTSSGRRRLVVLIGDLERLLDESPPDLNRDQPGDPRNPIRIHAALVARAPLWAADALAHRVIGQICEAWTSGRPGSHLGEDPIAVLSTHDPLIPRARRLLDRLRLSAPAPSRLPEGDAAPPSSSAKHQISPTPAATSPDPPPPSEDVAPAILSGTTDNEIFDTSCAGIFLLTRAVLDLRLHEQASSFVGQGFDHKGLGHGAWLLAAIGRFAAGSTELGGTIDPGLALFAGLDPFLPPTNAGLAEAWRDWSGVDSSATSWLRRLAGMRIMPATNARLIRLAPAPLGGREGLILADGNGRIWPLGRSVAGLDESVELARQWADAWSQAFGEPPSWVADPRLCVNLALAGLSAVPDDDPAPAAAALSSLGAVAPSAFGGTGDLPMGLLTLVVVRAGARWLKRLNGSTPAFLLDNIFHRPGRVSVGRRTVEITLAPKSLDIVLQLSGELDPIDEVPWLGRSLRFRIAETS